VIIEVDQSGRTDQTNKTTVLALSNKTSYAIVISSIEKRKLVAHFKKKNPEWSKSRICYQIFIELLFRLLEKHIHNTSLIILDEEYPGYQGDIKNRLLNRFGNDLDIDLVVRNIGKGSAAHKLAWQVYNNKKRGERVLAKNITKI